VLLEYFRPVVEKVLVERRILRVVSLKHRPIEPSDLFRFRGKVDGFVYEICRVRKPK
jgi:hypothetical protein